MLCLCDVPIIPEKRLVVKDFFNIFKFSFVKRYIFNLVKRFYYRFARKTLFFVKHAYRIEDTKGGDAGIGKDGSPHGSIAGKPGDHDDAFDT